MSTPVRVINLQRLVSEFGDVETVAALSDVDEGHLRSIVRGDKLRSGAARGVGNSVARKLEDGCSKPEGWMDTMPEERKPVPGDSVLTPDKRKLLVLYDRAPDEIKRLIMLTAELSIKLEPKRSPCENEQDAGDRLSKWDIHQKTKGRSKKAK